MNIDLLNCERPGYRTLFVGESPLEAGERLCQLMAERIECSSAAIQSRFYFSSLVQTASRERFPEISTALADVIRDLESFRTFDRVILLGRNVADAFRIPRSGAPMMVWLTVDPRGYAGWMILPSLTRLRAVTQCEEDLTTALRQLYDEALPVICERTENDDELLIGKGAW